MSPPPLFRIPARGLNSRGVNLGFGLIAAAMVLAPAPSRAETVPACWSPGTAPGLFDWTSTPAIACRDGAGAAPQGAAPATAGPEADTGAKPPRTTFRFSGSAHIGVTVAF